MTGEPSRRKRGRPPHPDILTPREWQVLDLIRQDLTNEQIAQRLDISPATAKYHVSEILSKLNLTTREQAAAWQPEPAPLSLWQRLCSVVAGQLHRISPAVLATVAGTLVALVGLALVAWAVLLPDAGETNQDVAAASPQTSPEPAFTIDRPQDTRLIFIRGQTNLYEPGTLWVSNLDGSDARQLVTRADVSQFIGAGPDPVSADPFLYYITKPQQGPDRREVWRANPAGQEELLLTLEAELPTSHMAELSPDGRFIVYTDTSSLSILDMASREARSVEVDAPGPSCPQPGACVRFFGPHWSPDGTRLSVNFGGLLLIDPFGDAAPIPLQGCCYVWWSPSGNSVCGSNEGHPPLFVHSAPDWQARPFLEDYQPSIRTTPSIITTGYLATNVLRCSWLDDQRLAVIHGVFIDQNGWEMQVLTMNTAGGELVPLTQFAGMVSSDVDAIPARDMVIFQARTQPPNTPTYDHPQTAVLFDLTTGLSQPLLTEDDWVVAVLDEPTGLD